VLTVTRDMILPPPPLTGSYPRPLWFDRSLAGRSFKAALGDSLFREQYLDAVASIIAEQEAAGSISVTDGDSRFDLTVGGKSCSSIPSNGWAASTATATPRADGCRATACGRARSCGRCRRPISPRGCARSSRAGPLEYTELWKVAQRLTDRPPQVRRHLRPRPRLDVVERVL